jgi:hypothetical protein
LASQTNVELLCGHHQLDEFDCGHIESNVLASGWLTKVSGPRHWRYADEMLAVAVVDDEHRVLGILATQDLRLTAADIGNSGELVGNFLFYQLFAVAQVPSRRRWLIVRQLLHEINAIRTIRLARDDYVGELAAPSRAAEAVRPRLIVYLERHGFRPLGSLGDLWYRPKSEPGGA